MRPSEQSGEQTGADVPCATDDGDAHTFPPS
jgi:hypothetical protein